MIFSFFKYFQLQILPYSEENETLSAGAVPQ